MNVVHGPFKVNVPCFRDSYACHSFAVDAATGLCAVGTQMGPQFVVYDLTASDAKRGKVVAKMDKLGNTIHISSWRKDSKFITWGICALAPVPGVRDFPSFVVCNSNNADDATAMEIRLKPSVRAVKAPVSEKTKKLKRKQSKAKAKAKKWAGEEKGVKKPTKVHASKPVKSVRM